MTRLFLFLALLGAVFTAGNAMAQDDDLVRAGYEAEAKRASISERIGRLKRGFKKNEAQIRERQKKQIEKNTNFLDAMKENRDSLDKRSAKVNEKGHTYKENLSENDKVFEKEREARVGENVEGLSSYTPNEKTRTQEQEDKRGLIDAYRSKELSAIKAHKPADAEIVTY
jgi:seryl-tRNA synthetase